MNDDDQQSSPPPSPASTLFGNVERPSSKAKRGRPRKGEKRVISTSGYGGPKGSSLKKARRPGSGRPPGSTKKVKIFFETHVEKKGDVLHCTECGESSASRSDMYFHIQRVHYPYNAVDKSDQFDYDYVPNKPVKEVHRSKYLQLQCNKCNSKFSGQCDLKRHEKAVHDKIKDYKCEECDYACARKDNMAGHILRMHGKTGLKEEAKAKSYVETTPAPPSTCSDEVNGNDNPLASSPTCKASKPGAMVVTKWW